MVTSASRVNEPLEPELVTASARRLTAHPERIPVQASVGRWSSRVSIDDVPMVAVTLRGGALAPTMQSRHARRPEVARDAVAEVPEGGTGDQRASCARQVPRSRSGPRAAAADGLDRLGWAGDCAAPSRSVPRIGRRRGPADRPAGRARGQHRGAHASKDLRNAVITPPAGVRILVARRGGGDGRTGAGPVVWSPAASRTRPECVAGGAGRRGQAEGANATDSPAESAENRLDTRSAGVTGAVRCWRSTAPGNQARPPPREHHELQSAMLPFHPLGRRP